MRIDDFISKSIGVSRSVSKQIIKQNRVMISGNIITDYKKKVEYQDIISCDDVIYSYEEFQYYMMNKPMGVICATEDNYQETVLSSLNKVLSKQLFPVGRLDKDSTGLLILTNDGNYCHKVTSPKSNIVKKYFVTFEGVYEDWIPVKFQEGIKDGEDVFAKATFEKISKNSCYVSVTEGKFHEVKRMCKQCGLKVTSLKRVQIGQLELGDSLAPGEYIKICEKDANQVFE